MESKPPELSQSQREHWEKQLEHALKAVQVAKYMLGLPDEEPIQSEPPRSD